MNKTSITETKDFHYLKDLRKTIYSAETLELV